ncbi:MAG: DUF305 domain-containing protein [Ignavibacteria bacterium]|nr:DUF305 domain-containing protein [Ignavibacteria bacterium]
MNSGNYKKLYLMLTLSFLIMYSVMFFNVEENDHIYLSLTRTYMAFLMTTPMAVMMILLMPKMYPNKKKNMIIISSNILIFIISLIFLRNQIPIGDEQYMKAMIPHHSSAILTSKNADIKDAEVKRLSEEIIKAQVEEIKQMKEILNRLKNE